VIGLCLPAGAVQRIHRRFELQEVLIGGRFALVGLDQFTGGLIELGNSLGATD
jgi:hypothetical protein